MAAPGDSARPTRDRSGLVGGLVLAGVGVFLLAAQLVPDIGRAIPLIIGLVFLALFVARREYGFLIAGSIISGVGVGVLLAESVAEPLSGALMVLSLAAGFGAIWLVGSLLRLPQNHWWPLIPGGILALVGAVQLADADVEGVVRWWPVFIIAAGVLIIARALVRQRG